MAKYSVDYLQRLSDAVERFEVAFERWMDTQVESTFLVSRGLMPTVSVKPGQEAAVVRRLELDVAEAAGAAGRAVAVTGAKIGVEGVGVLDAISNWSLMSSPKALFAPHDVRTTAANVRGRLSAMIDDARASGDTETPAFAPSWFHEVVWNAAAAQWTTRNHRVAVREAA
ncbi:hypothetical protein [Streptomyces lonarensis]|uniref:hypothetical protein n=1 Tax=Streptomyces lonarensis TaxID=700599 RepID=UPI001FD77C87|nr:hypothetical protein [Streptomyces lonarensis]